MKLFCHFDVIGFSNSYLLCMENNRDAVLIDPGNFDVKLLQLIEGNNLYIRHILVTHAHNAHINGVKTLLKIYDAVIYSYRSTILDFASTVIRDGDILKTAGFEFEIIETPGHSSDSISFKTEKLLFTGDTLTAGNIGATVNGYARGLEISSICKKIFSFDDDIYIFPGHGPPSKISIERKLNPYLKEIL